MARLEEPGQGRVQLQGVLSGLVEQAKQEESLLQALNVQGEADIIHFGAIKGLVGLQSPRKPQESKRGAKGVGGARSPKKKRKKFAKELEQQEECHLEASETSLVLTFFGQKVNLASLPDDASLYRICREWMRNSSEKESGGVVTGEHGEDPLILTPSSQPGSIHDLPDPLPYKGNNHHSRIPEPVPIQSGSLDVHIDQGDSVEDLRQTHLKTWKQAKKAWLDASSLNQKRFARSIEIVNNCYVPPPLDPNALQDSHNHIH